MRDEFLAELEIPIMRFVSLGLAMLVVVVLPGWIAGADAAEFFAVEHQRQTIYHSPQTPGFTSWVGAWTMPDGSLMISFTQATGPVEGRPQAPTRRAAQADVAAGRPSRLRHDRARPAKCPSPFDRMRERRGSRSVPTRSSRA